MYERYVATALTHEEKRFLYIAYNNYVDTFSKHIMKFRVIKGKSLLSKLSAF